MYDDVCGISLCQRKPSIIYLSVPLCDIHWDSLCERDLDTEASGEKRKLFPLKRGQRFK